MALQGTPTLLSGEAPSPSARTVYKRTAYLYLHKCYEYSRAQQSKVSIFMGVHPFALFYEYTRTIKVKALNYL